MFSTGVDALGKGGSDMNGKKGLSDKLMSYPGVITNAQATMNTELAEWVAFAILWHLKNGQAQIDDKSARVYNETRKVVSLQAKTVGIFGYGDIGMSCAKVLKNGFGVRKVIGMRKNPSRTTEEAAKFIDECWSQDKFDPFLKECDIIINVAPLTPDTLHIWNKSCFSAMKNDSLFVNIGRGKSVVESDLQDALVNKQIGAAAQDVFYIEPLDEKSQLWDAPNLLISPHKGGQTEHTFDRIFEKFHGNLESYLKNGVNGLDNIVDKNSGY